MKDNVQAINTQAKTEYDQFISDNKELLWDICQLNDEINRHKKLLENKKALLLRKLESANIPSVNSYGRIFLRVGCSSYKKLNSKKFRKDYPQLFDKYSETVYKEEYLTMRGAKRK